MAFVVDVNESEITLRYGHPIHGRTVTTTFNIVELADAWMTSGMSNDELFDHFGFDWPFDHLEHPSTILAAYRRRQSGLK